MSTKFEISSIRALEEIPAILGPEEVTFHYMDDKAKVPISITAAKKVPISFRSVSQLQRKFRFHSDHYHNCKESSDFIPISITTANRETPLFMHMEYQVTLPDHDFVADYKHKLIPSVIGDMKVVKSNDLTNDAVSYSGPTYIAIRSAKHSGSSAFHHL